MVCSIFLFSTLFFAIPHPSQAQIMSGGEQAPTETQTKEYTPLVIVPGLNDPESGGSKLPSYLSNLFMFAISIAGVLAVIVIVIGGIRYISSDAISGKSEGKAMIKEAVWGLVLAMLAWLLLYTINPALLRTTLNLQDPEISNAPLYEFKVRTFTYPFSGPNSQQTFCSPQTFTSLQECQQAIPGIKAQFSPSQYQIAEGSPSCVTNCVPAQIPNDGPYTTELKYGVNGTSGDIIKCVGTFPSKAACDQVIQQTIAPYMPTDQYIFFNSLCKPTANCNPTQ